MLFVCWQGYIVSHTGTLKWLVAKGGDVKVQSNKGKTALDMARSRGMADVIAYMKTCGKHLCHPGKNSKGHVFSEGTLCEI